MNRALRWVGAGLLCLAAVLAGGVSPSHAGEKTKILVGRVSHVEGQLLRYIYEEKDWAAIVSDTPFGLEDALYTDQDARAEFTLPNGAWVRIGGSTQIQLVKIQPDLTEIDVASGVARFTNRSEEGVIKVTSPFGYVVAYGDTVFDIYVGDDSVEVIGIAGTVEFVHQGDESRYEVEAGSTSIIANASQIVAADGKVDGNWDDWNLARDDLWTKRVEVKGDSIEYLPPNLHEDAYALEENGRWEKVYHDGEYRTLWKPTRVSAGWAPFTAGRWSVYYGDNCWVPDEPFGYVTHHYGNWVRVDSCSCWYWSPPRVRRVATRVHADWYEDYDWCPGRVGWVHRDDYVGWVPLAPTEPYYSHNYWGISSVVVDTVPRVSINIGGYRYLDDAVIVNHGHFYGVNNYSSVRVTNINRTTIVNNYHSSPVINNTVINNYNNIRERHHTRNIHVDRAPHDSVVRRIEHNQRHARELGNVRAADVERNLSRTREGRIGGEGRIGRPEVTNRLVDRGHRSKPDSEVQFGGKRDLIRNARHIQDAPDSTRGHRSGRNASLGRDLPTGGIQDDSAGGDSRTQGRPGRPWRDGSLQRMPDDAQPNGGREMRRPGRMGRSQDQGAGGEEVSSVDGRDRVRPVRPGRDLRTNDGDSGGQDVRDAGLRPVRPGRDRGAETTATVEDGQSGRGRLRPVRPGRELQTDGGDSDGQDVRGAGLRPVRPGRDRGAETTAAVEDGQSGRGRLRPVRPGRELQTDGGDSGGQDVRGAGLRPVRPGRDRGIESSRQQEVGGEGSSPRSPRDRMRGNADAPETVGVDRNGGRRGVRDSFQSGSPQQGDSRGGDRGPQQGNDRRQAMEQRRLDQQQERQQQMEQQQQQRQQAMQQQRQQQQQQVQEQRRQQQEQQRAQQQQQRQQQMEQQRQQQQQQQQSMQQQRQQQQQQVQEQRRQQQEQQRAQQQQQRQQQMEQQRQQQQQQQQQQRQQLMQQQRQQQQQERQQQMQQQRQQQQQQRQNQRQQRQRPGQDPNDPNQPG